MQGQRCPVGVTAASGLRLRDTALPARQVQTRTAAVVRGCVGGKTRIYLYSSSKCHKEFLLGPSYDPKPARVWLEIQQAEDQHSAHPTGQEGLPLQGTQEGGRCTSTRVHCPFMGRDLRNQVFDLRKLALDPPGSSSPSGEGRAASWEKDSRDHPWWLPLPCVPVLGVQGIM